MRNLKLGLMALLLLFHGCNSNNKLKYHGREVLQGSPSEELQLKAVKMNDWNIRYIDHPYESVQRVAIEKKLSNFFSINNPSESIAIYALKSMTYSNTSRQQLIDLNPIGVIKNPSEDLQLLAIKKSSSEVIKHIKNPTERVQILALNDDADNIKYIKNPSEKIKIMAVKLSPTAIFYISSPSKRVKSELIESLLKKSPNWILWTYYRSYKVPNYVKNNPRIIAKIKTVQESYINNQKAMSSVSTSSSSSSSGNGRNCQKVLRTKTVYVPGGHGRTSQQNYYEEVCN